MRSSGWVVWFVGAVGLACGGASSGIGEDWDGETTFVCAGNDIKTLHGETVDLKGKDLIAIDAAGNCQLTIIDCDITADFPLKAAGNAKVTISGGRLHGNKQAIQSWGNAVVVLADTKVEGETVKTGNGQILGP